MWSFLRQLPAIFPLWIVIAMIVYVAYGFFRTWYIFKKTMNTGFFSGLYDVYLDGHQKPIYDNSVPQRVIGYEPRYLRLYHIIWALIDIPCLVMGACLPFIRRVFTVKIAPIRRPKEEDLD